MILADSQLVLGANHTQTLHAADLALLEFEFLAVDVHQPGADGSQHNLLAGSHVGSAANHLERLAFAYIQLGDVQMVAVGMLHALQNLCHNHACQAAWNLLHGLHVLHLKAGKSQHFSHLLRSQVKLQIIFKPIVRYCHICILFKQ